MLIFLSSNLQAIDRWKNEKVLIRAFGDPIRAGKIVYSNNGKVYAHMQGDENFVIYGKKNKVCWASDTYEKDKPDSDALVSLTHDRFSVWAKNKRTGFFEEKKVIASRSGEHPFSLVYLQDDGNLVVVDSVGGIQFSIGIPHHCF